MKIAIFVFSWFLLNLAGFGDSGPISGIRAESKYLQYYGNDFSEPALAQMRQFDVLVLDPKASNLTPAVVADLQSYGALVLAYISIGEEPPSVGDPAVGDGSGPLTWHNGAIVSLNQGVASYYVDLEFDDQTTFTYVSDNQPDLNRNFGGRFIYPDAAWRQVLKTQRLNSARAIPGLDQMVGNRVSEVDTNRDHDFGFDGFFLDTVDTAGPFDNVWGYYPWAAEAMRDTVKFIDETYPDKLVMANRGVFYYNPAIRSNVFSVRPYEFTIRPYVDAILFESYYLDSNVNNLESPFFADNKHNYAPKISAEASRPDGFTVFCLDYEMERGENFYETFVAEAIIHNGWIGYLAPNEGINSFGDFVLNADIPADLTGPSWDSTQTPGSVSADVPDNIGLQRAFPGAEAGRVILEWDVALDQNMPVGYNVYFSEDPDFTDFTVYRRVLTEPGAGWAVDPVTSFANRSQVIGLAPGTWYFRVRAEDSANPVNEEQNEVTQTVTLDLFEGVFFNFQNSFTLDGELTEWSNLDDFGTDPVSGIGPDWQTVTMAHTAEKLWIGITAYQPIVLDAKVAIYLDTDRSANTGFLNPSTVAQGADFLIEGTVLYSYAGTGSDFDWDPVGFVDFATNDNFWEIAVNLADLGQPAYVRSSFIITDNGTDYFPNPGQFFTYRISEDLDLDGLDDAWELVVFGNLDQTGADDPDADGLDNSAEFNAMTKPLNPDSDGDQMTDGWEVDNQLNPLDEQDANLDPDGDGFSNLAEFLGGFDPQIADDAAVMLELVNGWNLVAIPRTLVDPTVFQVFGEAPVGAVWAWDAQNKRYLALDRQSVMSQQFGYWIYVDETTVIVY